MTKIFYLD